MNKLGSTLLCAALVLFSLPADTASAADKDVHGSLHSAVKRARAFTGWMAFRSHQTHTMLRKARSKKRTRLAGCLNDKLTQLHAIERVGHRDRRAIEAAVRIDGLTGHHMVHLVGLHDASQAVFVAASECGKKVSRRVRLPTAYRVRVFKPTLPAVFRR